MSDAAAPVINQPQGAQPGGGTGGGKKKGKGWKGGSGRGAAGDSPTIPRSAHGELNASTPSFEPTGGSEQPKGGRGGDKGQGVEGSKRDAQIGRRENQAAGGSAPSDASQSAGSAPADQSSRKGNKAGGGGLQASVKLAADAIQQAGSGSKKKAKQPQGAVASADTPSLEGAAGDPARPAGAKGEGGVAKSKKGGGRGKGGAKGGATGVASQGGSQVVIPPNSPHVGIFANEVDTPELASLPESVVVFGTEPVESGAAGIKFCLVLKVYSRSSRIRTMQRMGSARFLEISSNRASNRASATVGRDPSSTSMATRRAVGSKGSTGSTVNRGACMGGGSSGSNSS